MERFLGSHLNLAINVLLPNVPTQCFSIRNNKGFTLYEDCRHYSGFIGAIHPTLQSQTVILLTYDCGRPKKGGIRPFFQKKLMSFGIKK